MSKSNCIFLLRRCQPTARTDGKCNTPSYFSLEILIFYFNYYIHNIFHTKETCDFNRSRVGKWELITQEFSFSKFENFRGWGLGFQKSLRISEVEGWVFKEVWELSRLRFWIEVREFWKGSSKILKIWGENEGRSFEVFREFSCIETSFYHPSTFCNKIYMYLYLHKSLNFGLVYFLLFSIFFFKKTCLRRYVFPS